MSSDENNDDIAPIAVDTGVFQDEELFEPLDDDEPDIPTRSTKTSLRVQWEKEEVKEFEFHFSNQLKAKTVPNKNDCLKAIKKSKTNGGGDHRRYWHPFVKKVSYINHRVEN